MAAFLQKDDVHEGHPAAEETEHEDVPRELEVRVSGKVHAVDARISSPIQGPLDGFARLERTCSNGSQTDTR